MATILETQAVPLGPRDAGIPLTAEEFDEAEYEEGYRYELIHGVLVATPPPLEGERDSNEELGYLLRHYQNTHPQGNSLDLTLPEHNIYIPIVKHNRRADRAIWAGFAALPRTHGDLKLRDVPTIVVEFPSSRPADQRRDYDEKKIEYRDAGAQEYWIIDRFRREMTVYRWRGKRWVKQTVKEDDVYRTPLLPGFELPLAELLAISDRYHDPS